MSSGKTFLKIAALALAISLLFVFSMPEDGGTYSASQDQTNFYIGNTSGEQAFLDLPLMKRRALRNYPRRSREAVQQLNSIAVASICFMAENNYWGKTFDKIGWGTCGETRFAYFLNSCREVIPATDGFEECPAQLKKFFKDNPYDKEKGFHAAAVRQRRNGTFNIWVVDWRKDPMPLEEFAPYQP